MILKVKKLHPDAKLPAYAHPGDAGLDLYSVENVVIRAGERYAVATGIALELEPGFVSLIWDRSGVALKNGIKTMGGVIEHTYRGEYKIIMFNTSHEDYQIKKGDRVAQLLVQSVITAEVIEVDELSETVRGEGAFGSTGK